MLGLVVRHAPASVGALSFRGRRSAAGSLTYSAFSSLSRRCRPTLLSRPTQTRRPRPSSPCSDTRGTPPPRSMCSSSTRPNRDPPGAWLLSPLPLSRARLMPRSSRFEGVASSGTGLRPGRHQTAPGPMGTPRYPLAGARSPADAARSNAGGRTCQVVPLKSGAPRTDVSSERRHRERSVPARRIVRPSGRGGMQAGPPRPGERLAADAQTTSE